MTNGAQGISRWFRFRLEIHTPRPWNLGIYHQQKDLGSDTRFQFSIRCIAKRAELADIFLKISVYWAFKTEPRMRQPSTCLGENF